MVCNKFYDLGYVVVDDIVSLWLFLYNLKEQRKYEKIARSGDGRSGGRNFHLTDSVHFRTPEMDQRALGLER